MTNGAVLVRDLFGFCGDSLVFPRVLTGFNTPRGYTIFFFLLFPLRPDHFPAERGPSQPIENAMALRTDTFIVRRSTKLTAIGA